MPKVELPQSEALYPVPVVLVSCIDKRNNKSNIITIAWCGVVCSKPPILSVSIRPSRYSHKLIKDTGDFVVNIPSADMIKRVDACGMTSGSETDKFKACSFTETPATKVISPMIYECPVNIECKLKSIIELGTHDMFLGVVVAVHADSSVVGKGGAVDHEKTRPVVYSNGQYWDLGKKVGNYGFSSK